MSENEDDLLTYTNKHSSIVLSGIDAIKKVFNNADTTEIRSILLCLDKYLDPYYGYNLPYFDEIIILLQEQMFLTKIKNIKKDILELLRHYSKKSLDYLAEKIEDLEMEPELLEEALYALGNTSNLKYVPVIIKYELHCNSNIRNTAKEILIELSKQKTSSEP